MPGGSAQYLMTLNYRDSEIAVVAPMNYFSIAFGGLLAYFLGSEIPDTQSLSGITIIVASSLYTLYRELLQRKNQA